MIRIDQGTVEVKKQSETNHIMRNTTIVFISEDGTQPNFGWYTYTTEETRATGRLNR
jgi:hypothetical protein